MLVFSIGVFWALTYWKTRVWERVCSLFLLLFEEHRALCFGAKFKEHQTSGSPESWEQGVSRQHLLCFRTYSVLPQPLLSIHNTAVLTAAFSWQLLISLACWVHGAVVRAPVSTDVRNAMQLRMPSAEASYGLCMLLAAWSSVQWSPDIL